MAPHKNDIPGSLSPYMIKVIMRAMFSVHMWPCIYVNENGDSISRRLENYMHLESF